MHTTPPSLLERLRRPGEEPAWERFVQLYTPLLYYRCLLAGLQESDAADLVQEVFALLVRKLPEFDYDRRKSFRAWLRTVFLNKWRERRRAQRGPVLAPLSGDAAGADDVAEFAEAEFRKHL